MGRLTDNDRHFGPITFGRTEWWALSVHLVSGGDDDCDVRDPSPNTLRLRGFGWIADVRLPFRLIKPYVEISSWRDGDVEREYREYFPREYGFHYYDGYLRISLGAQTHSSTTTQAKSWFLPWTEWKFVRTALYGLDGSLFWEQYENKPKNPQEGRDRFDHYIKAKDECPRVQFLIEDYDGEQLTATTYIEEREWSFGTKWFSWLRLFRKNKVRRSLSIELSKELGPEKGSYKGGIIGTGIDMLPGELHLDAFKRFCEQEHHSKYRDYKVKLLKQQ